MEPLQPKRSMAAGSSSASQQTYTVDDAIESLGIGPFQYLVLGMAGLCWTADAMEMLLLSFIKLPLQCLWSISDAQAAFITTSVGLGMLVGALSWGMLADSYGRRKAFLAAASLTFTSGIISAMSVSYPMMVIARGIAGFGIGGVPVAFSLLTEFLPMRNRGSWGMGLAFFWSVGALFEALIAMAVMPHLGFRWLIALSSLPLGVLLIFAPLLPESPRWLVSQGRISEAAEILARASNVNGRTLPAGTLVAPVLDASPNTAQSKGQVAELVRPGVRSLSLKLWFIWFACGFLYYGAVMLQPDMLAAENAGRRCGYASSQCGMLTTFDNCKSNNLCAWSSTGVCRPSGVEKSRAGPCASKLRRADYITAMYSTAGELPGTILILVLIDAVGRRALLGYLFGMCAIAFGLLYPCLGPSHETAVFFVLRAATNGFFQGAYLFTNELYPSSVRATGMGMASSIARIGLITTPFVAQYLDNISFGLAISLYAAASTLGVFAVWEVPIETTGRPMLSTTDELVALLPRKGDPHSDSKYDFPTFSNDPSVSWWMRMLRWPAKIDGGATVSPFI